MTKSEVLDMVAKLQAFADTLPDDSAEEPTEAFPGAADVDVEEEDEGGEDLGSYAKTLFAGK